VIRGWRNTLDRHRGRAAERFLIQRAGACVREIHRGQQQETHSYHAGQLCESPGAHHHSIRGSYGRSERGRENSALSTDPRAKSVTWTVVRQLVGVTALNREQPLLRVIHLQCRVIDVEMLLNHPLEPPANCVAISAGFDEHMRRQDRSSRRLVEATPHGSHRTRRKTAVSSRQRQTGHLRGRQPSLVKSKTSVTDLGLLAR